MVFVAQVDINFLDADGPGGNQHAFEETVRVALEVDAVLEGAGLALVDVDRHQARALFGPHDAPFAARGKAGAAEAAQAGIFHGLDDRLDILLAGDTLLEQGVTAGGLVGREVHKTLGHMFDRAGGDRGHHGFAGGIRDRVLPDDGRRGLLAAPDAGRGDDPDLAAQQAGQFGQQVLGARHLAGQAITHPHRQRRRRGLAFLDHVEVVVEGRDLVDLGLRQPHFLRQRRQVGGRQVAEVVLQLVQVLDQQVGLARLAAQQPLYIGQRRRIDAAAFGRLAFSLFGGGLQDGDGDDGIVHVGC